MVKRFSYSNLRGNTRGVESNRQQNRNIVIKKRAGLPQTMLTHQPPLHEILHSRSDPFVFFFRKLGEKIFFFFWKKNKITECPETDSA